MLAAGDATGDKSLTTIAGWEGLFCGASAIYTGFAQVLKEVYGKTVMPLGSVGK